MTRFSFLRPVLVVLVAVGILTSPNRASAEERQYFSRSTAVLDIMTGDFVATGNATHLGKYTETGNVVISGDDPTALHVEGSATLVAANGDELCVVIIGQMDFLAGTITGTITFDGATTGRFQDATGSASLVAQVQANGTIAVVIEGFIDY
jgi:hypothetical protein